jgi:hypothetical protein
MRVNKIAIRKQTTAEYDKVILKLESPFEDFLEHIDITLYNEWDAKQLGSKYTIKKL